MKIPAHGKPHDQIKKELEAFSSRDLPWREGKTLAYIYDPGEEIEQMEEEQRSKKLVFNLANDEERAKEPAKSAKVAGRNDACPCGSGKKYKKCCGK